MKFILFILFVLCVLCGEWEYDFIECEQLFMIYLWRGYGEKSVDSSQPGTRDESRVSVTADQNDRQSAVQRPACHNTN